MKKTGPGRARIAAVIAGLVFATAIAASAGDFWGVRYGESATEGGSSGSALMNDRGQVIGQLTGGNVTCDNVNRSGVYDIFGKFSVSWKLGLSEHLGDGGDDKSGEPEAPPLVSPAREKDPVRTPTPGELLRAPIAEAHTVVVSPESIATALAELAAEPADGTKRLKVGVHIDAPSIDPAAWEKLTDETGRTSWRVAIRAAGAASLRLHFAALSLEGVERAVVYADPTDVAARDVKPTKTAELPGFWGPIVRGETVVLEVVTESETPPAIEIDRISYGARDPASGALTPQVGDCYLDPSCYPKWESEMLGVSQLLFESGDSQVVCTGTLLADEGRTYTPWLLTANHCIGTEAEANTLIATFFFFTDSCNGYAPNWNNLPYTEGADIVAESTKTDFTLVKLDEEPPAGVVYQGWTTAEPDTGDDVLVLHHPGGTYMRISFADVIGEYENTVFGDDSRSGGDDDDTGCGS